MCEYTYKRPKGYREKDGKILNLPMLEPKCMKCGSPIKSGKYCPECEKKVMDDVKTVYKKVAEKTPVTDDKDKRNGPRMHTNFGRS